MIYPKIIIFAEATALSPSVKETLTLFPYQYVGSLKQLQKISSIADSLFVVHYTHWLEYQEWAGGSGTFVEEFFFRTFLYIDEKLSLETQIEYYQKGVFYLIRSRCDAKELEEKIRWSMSKLVRSNIHVLLSKQLERQYQVQKQFVEAQNEMLQMAVHDLRSPLSAMICYSELLMDGILDQIPNAPSNPLEIIHQNCQFLIALINDLLDSAQLESGKKNLPLEKCDFPVLLKKVIDSLSGLAGVKSIQFSVEINEVPPIYINPQKMERVIINLLSNAIKFTKANGSINIHCSARENRVILAIQDTGPGISKSDIEHIFDKFHIGQKGKIEGKGHGLGLSIAKKFVEMHGGEIYVESVRHRGSTFVIHLPVERRLTRKSSEFQRKIGFLDLGRDLNDIDDLEKKLMVEIHRFTSFQHFIDANKTQNFLALLINEKQHFGVFESRFQKLLEEAKEKNRPVFFLAHAIYLNEFADLFSFLNIHIVKKPLEIDKFVQRLSSVITPNRRLHEVKNESAILQ